MDYNRVVLRYKRSRSVLSTSSTLLKKTHLNKNKRACMLHVGSLIVIYALIRAYQLSVLFHITMSSPTEFDFFISEKSNRI